MKPDSLQLRKLYALAASSCLCAGSLMILKSLWDLFGMPAFSPLPAEKASELLSPAILLLVSALCLILLKWSSEKNLRLPLWGGLFLLALLAADVLQRLSVPCRYGHRNREHPQPSSQDRRIEADCFP